MTTAKLRNSTGNSVRISGGKSVTRYTILRRRVRFERTEQTSRDAGYFIDGLQERALVCLQRFANTLVFLTNWSEAARVSSGVAGGSKLKRGLMFLHIAMTSSYQNPL
jgi:hypothetical protein